jgi:hypothetical protein
LQTFVGLLAPLLVKLAVDYPNNSWLVSTGIRHLDIAFSLSIKSLLLATSKLLSIGWM